MDGTGDGENGGMDRREFVRRSAAAGALVFSPALAGAKQAAGAKAGSGAASVAGAEESSARSGPAIRDGAASRPVVISDRTGFDSRAENGDNAVARAFRRMTEGADVLDALIDGVNIPELDPEETGVGYGGVPNADGVVQLDSCCMHGPNGWAGGVAAIEGVRTPSKVARAVAAQTDHHLLVGPGARAFARQMGMDVHQELTTDRALEIWREWKRRIDPEHWLEPSRRGAGGDPDGSGGESASPEAMSPGATDPEAVRRMERAGRRAGLEMVREGRVSPTSYWGTISCEGVGPGGGICGVTSTSGLYFKIPGRVGDSPILGAGQYVDDQVGAAGSTGRGEANLYSLSTFRIVEEMRRGASPKDAGMAALERIAETTTEPRLLNDRGMPNFDVRFFVVNKAGEYAGVALYGTGESEFAVCDEDGPRLEPLEGLLGGGP